MEETEFESLRGALVHYEAPQRKYEITTILWANNKEFVIKLQGYRNDGYSWKQAYRKIQGDDVWKVSRILLFEYFQGWTGLFEFNGTEVVKCRHCGCTLTKSFTMHHSAYDNGNYLNPLYIEMVCGPCHTRHHKGAHKR